MPVTATAGCLDGNHVSFLHLPADLGRQLLAAQEVAADPARLAAGYSPRPVAPAIGEQGEARWFEDSHGADDAVAAAVIANSARPVDQLVALDPHGILYLEGLDGSVESIAHTDVDSGGSGAPVTRPLAAADGLVVRPALAPDHGVVHRPLALRGYLLWGEAGERGEHGVRDAVGGLDVPRYDRRRVGRVDQAPPWGLYGEWGVRAGVGEYVFGEQHAQGEVAGRTGDGEGAIYVAAGGIEGGEYGVLAAAFNKLVEALCCDVVRGDLGPQVAAPEAGGADVGEDEIHHVGHVHAVAHQTHWRDDDALLED